MARRKQTLAKIGLLVASIAIALVVGELLLRYRFGVVTHRRSSVVDHIQQYLVTHPRIGFLWEPNIPAERRIQITWADQDPNLTILSTDAWGFRNAPGAIEDRRRNRPVDVVGVGDSFVEIAAGTWYELFAERLLRYHSFAMHRQSPPQYTLILAEYALPLEPNFVIYGIYENDFYEIRDFEAWQASGMDWFAYHSGTWCGPPYDSKRFWTLPGYRALWRAARPKSFAEAQARRIVDHGLDRVCDEALAAAAMCRKASALMLVVLIPGPSTLLHGIERPEACYDHIVEVMGRRGVDVLDLRLLIKDADDPLGLYFKKDGHWNRRGMRLAGRAIYRELMAMRDRRQEGRSRAVPTTLRR